VYLGESERLCRCWSLAAPLQALAVMGMAAAGRLDAVLGLGFICRLALVPYSSTLWYMIVSEESSRTRHKAQAMADVGGRDDPWLGVLIPAGIPGGDEPA
jgi:hypothetical protein